MIEKQLKSSAECAQKFCLEYTGEGAKTMRYEALNAIASLTLRDLNDGKSARDCQYTVFEIFDEIKGSGTHLDDESIRKRVNGYLKKLEEKLPSHSEMLNEIATENKLTHIPGYSFSLGRGGGSGNSSKHSLIPVEVTLEQSESGDEIKVQGNMVKYRLETIENLPPWARWLNNLELSGWRLMTMTISILVIMAMMLLLLLMFLGSLSSLNNYALGIQTFITFVCIELLLYWLIRPYFLCGSKRIFPAPILMLPANIVNGQIESVATDEIRKSTGRKVRKLRLVSYAGTCSICNSRIELESGGKEYFNRLIGRCLEAPDEHVFSFDRVSKIGFPLREYYKK